MTALDVLYNICNNDSLLNFNFKYCLVDAQKHPLKLSGNIAKPNVKEDFVDLEQLYSVDLEKYHCLGISIQASNVCAIDIDDCVSIAFDTSSISQLATDIINMFSKVAYIEFSFSGHGIRIFFQNQNIQNYEQLYYVKNSKLGIEFYQPSGSARYVTITGKTIINNDIMLLDEYQSDIVDEFLETYMKRPIILNTVLTEEVDNRSIDVLMKQVKLHYLKNFTFQDLWFSNAPGSGKDESERDYHLVAYLYENITKDKDKLKSIFEQSNFFKTKDFKHISKWTKSDYRYYNYLYDRIRRK